MSATKIASKSGEFDGRYHPSAFSSSLTLHIVTLYLRDVFTQPELYSFLFLAFASLLCYLFQLSSILTHWLSLPLSWSTPCSFVVTLLILVITKRLSKGFIYSPSTHSCVPRRILASSASSSSTSRSSEEMKWYTVVISGVTTGLGHAVVVELLKLSPNIRIHALVRGDARRRSQLATELTHEAGVPHDTHSCEGNNESTIVTAGERLILHEVDLSSFASIRSFIQRFTSSTTSSSLISPSSIDVLINNAAVMMNVHSLSVDGVEQQLVVNTLSHFYLTERLLPQLKRSDHGGRVVNVGSHGHLLLNEFDWKVWHEMMLEPSCYNSFNCYCLTKLGMQLNFSWFAAQEKEKEKEKEGEEEERKHVYFYSCHPGTVASGLPRHSGSAASIFFNSMSYLFFKTAKEGTATPVWLSVAEHDDTRMKDGAFFEDGVRQHDSELAHNVQLVKQFHQYSSSLISSILQTLDRKPE